MGFYLRKEWRGLGLTAPFKMRRYEIDVPSRPGQGLWSVGWNKPTLNVRMKDENGVDQDFYIDRPRLLQTGGRVIIRHRGVNLNGYGTNYAIYANARIQIVGPAASNEALGALDWNAPSGSTLMLDGGNIMNAAHHYFTANLAAETVLQPGYYRLEVYGAAGSDADDSNDELGDVSDYNQNNIHQFWATVL